MMMVMSRNKAYSALLLVVAVFGATTSVQGRSSNVASFRPETRLPLINTNKRCPADLVDNKVNISQKTLALRGGVANTLSNAFAGSVVFALIEIGVKKSLAAANLKFPAQLGGCIFLFASLLLTEAVNPATANSIFSALTPGAGLLSKWLPVFFVPGLVMLPLSPSIGSGWEVRHVILVDTLVDSLLALISRTDQSVNLTKLCFVFLLYLLRYQILKVLLVVSLGFVYTITSTTYTVLGMRILSGGIKPKPTSALAANLPKPKKGNSAPVKAFSDETANFFSKTTLGFGILSILATRQGFAYATPIQTLFLTSFTVSAYVWGARLPAAFTKLVHPLVTSSAVILVSIALLGKATGSSFLDCLRTFKVGSLDPTKAGPGDVLLYLLGPSVVCFAISMYSRRDLLRSNLLVVLTGMFVSSAGGLFGTAAFVRAISLGGSNGRMVRLSVLARNVTTALSMALTAMLGGDISIAASVVVMTGIIGATYGKTLLTALDITDPITRGLAVGASSQGLGVASIADEPDAFPFAAIAMVLNAISATTLVSIPVVKDALIKVATGA